MHRSGTSAVANLLHRAGLAVPGEPLPPHPFDNPHGYFEPRAMTGLNNRLLTVLGSSWRIPHLFSAAELESRPVLELLPEMESWLREIKALGKPLMLKDPRMCRLLPIWLPAMKKLGFGVAAVLVVRNAHDVAASLARRADHSDICSAAITDAVQSLLLWLEHTLEARRTLHEASIACHITAFEGFMASARTRRELLGGLIQQTGVALDPCAADSGFSRPQRGRSSSRGDAFPPSLSQVADHAQKLFLNPTPANHEEMQLHRLLRAEIGKDLGLKEVTRLRGLYAAAHWACPVSHLQPSWLFLSDGVGTKSHLYRVQQPVDAINRAGLTAAWSTPELALASPEALLSARILVIHRSQWSEALAQCVAVARRGGAHVLADFDDLVFEPDRIDADGISWISSLSAPDREVHRIKFQGWRRLLEAADTVAVTTPALAQRVNALDKPVILKPNGLSPEILAAASLHADRETTGDGFVRIGYASGTFTHEKDIAEIQSALLEVLRRKPECRLVLVGNIRARGLLSDLDPARIERRSKVPWPNLPAEFARFDINLAPLEPGTFTACKSPIKWTETAAVGVPTVASSHGAFAHWIEPDNTGLLAETPEQWCAALERLIESPDYRRRIGEAARIHVTERFAEDRLIEEFIKQVDSRCTE